MMYQHVPPSIRLCIEVYLYMGILTLHRPTTNPQIPGNSASRYLLRITDNIVVDMKERVVF